MLPGAKRSGSRVVLAPDPLQAAATSQPAELTPLGSFRCERGRIVKLWNDQREGVRCAHRQDSLRQSAIVQYGSSMKLTDNNIPGIVVVRGYSPGELRLGETTLHDSCLLAADRVVANWGPRTVQDLTVEHIKAVVALNPEVVVLGTGLRQRFPDRALIAKLLSRGIGVEVMDTGAACRTYNVLVSEDRRAVAALLLHDD